MADLFSRNPRSERRSIESLFMRGKEKGEEKEERKRSRSRDTHTRGPRDLTVRSRRGSSSPVHGDDNDSQGGPPRATSFVPVVEVSARHHRRIYILLLLLFSFSSSTSVCRTCCGDSRNSVSTSFVSVRSAKDARLRESNRGERSTEGRRGEHTRKRELVEAWTVFPGRRSRDAAREATVRRLGLNLTDSVLALPLPQRVAPPAGRERTASGEGVEAYRVPRASTIISPLRAPALAHGRGGGEASLLYLRGVIDTRSSRY